MSFRPTGELFSFAQRKNLYEQHGAGRTRFLAIARNDN